MVLFFTRLWLPRLRCYQGKKPGSSSFFLKRYHSINPQRSPLLKMSRPNLILTGFMATGKTTVGKILAEQLSYTFVDTDELIARKTKMSIADIFSEKGEAFFRKLESDTALELSQKQGFVISTGGGFMLNPVNKALLGEKGHVFCLVATAQEIFRRVSNPSATKRPLLETANPLQRIEKLMREREPAYGDFTQISTSGKTPEEVVVDIIGRFQP